MTAMLEAGAEVATRAEALEMETPAATQLVAETRVHVVEAREVAATRVQTVEAEAATRVQAVAAATRLAVVHRRLFREHRCRRCLREFDVATKVQRLQHKNKKRCCCYQKGSIAHWATLQSEMLPTSKDGINQSDEENP